MSCRGTAVVLWPVRTHLCGSWWERRVGVRAAPSETNPESIHASHKLSPGFISRWRSVEHYCTSKMINHANIQYNCTTVNVILLSYNSSINTLLILPNISNTISLNVLGFFFAPPVEIDPEEATLIL